MGYSTDFNGSLKFNKPVAYELKDYIKKFNETRRMKRDIEKIKENYPNWEDLCFEGCLGYEGAYFIGGNGFLGQDEDGTIINYNYSPKGQPGLWCQWIINEHDELEWDGNEKFYNYVEWLKYLIKHFFEPLGYILNGDIAWQGEDEEDFGIIHVEDNCVTTQEGNKYYSMDDFETKVLIAELEKRGYTVS